MAAPKRIRIENVNPQPGPSNQVPKEIEKEIEKVPPKYKDLNSDCLLQIFTLLTKTNSMSIADYDEEVLDAFRDIFKTKFSQKIFDISNDPVFNETGESKTKKRIVEFGDEMTILNLTYLQKFRQYDNFIESAIIQHCRTLKVIRFENANCRAMIGISKPFEQIDKVEFVSSQFGALISNFSKWFPNATSLKLINQIRQTSEQRQLLERYHPKLEHFEIQNFKTPDYNKDVTEGNFNDKNLNNFIKFNPQLTSLKIIGDAKADMMDGITFDDFLLITIGKLENLKTLNISFDMTRVYFSIEIRCNTLKKLIINARDGRNAVTFPISFDSVDILIFSCLKIKREEIHEFFGRCKSVKKLFLATIGICTSENFVALSRLPRLEELQLAIRLQELYFLKECVGNFLESCKNLQKLTIFIMGKQENKEMIIEKMNDIAGLIRSTKWGTKVIVNIDQQGPTLVIFRNGS